MPVTLASVDGTFVNPSSYDAGEVRRADAALVSQAGISSGLVVTVDASDLVTVTRGQAIISGEDAATGTGVYRAGTAGNVSGSLTARDATNSRIDLVVFRQYDTDVVGSHPRFKSEIEIIEGTPSATPSAPAKPSMAVELAKITVPASGGGAATVDNSGRVSALAIGVDPAPVVLRQAGKTVITTGASGTVTSQSVTFPTPFGAGVVPIVQATVVTSRPDLNFAGVSTATNTGFTMYLYRNASSATLDVNWHAVEPS